MLRATFVLDYQNVHLTARDVFDPHGDAHVSLIRPMSFAKQAVAERNRRQQPGMPHAELSRVLVYRGLPHVDYDWEQNRRCLDQASQWRIDGAIVELRDLKYSFQCGADGRAIFDVNGKKVPTGRPKEKGIDVLCALACVREAVDPDIDLVVLASRDTDLVPVLDEYTDTLLDLCHRYPDDPLIGPHNPTTKDPLGKVRQYVEWPSNVTFKPARLRTSWMVSVLTNGTRVSEFRRISGTVSAKTLEAVAEFVPGRLDNEEYLFAAAGLREGTT